MAEDDSGRHWLVSRFRGLRGLFADPEDLSLLALVDLFSTRFGDGHASRRVTTGSHRSPAVIARPAQCHRPPRPVSTVTSYRAWRSRPACTRSKRTVSLSALPATSVRGIDGNSLVNTQHGASAHLRYGAATLLVQYELGSGGGRPNAFGSDQPTGAVWDSNERQKAAREF